MKHKRVFSIPILHLSSKTHVVIRANKGNAIIVSENDLKSEDNVKLIEDCIENNIKYTEPRQSQRSI